MAAQKQKKNYWQKFFVFLNALIKIHNHLDSSGPYRRLSENQITGGSRELFLPENGFQTSSTKFLPKKNPDFGGLQTNQRHEIQTSFFSHAPLYMNSIYSQNCFGHL